MKTMAMPYLLAMSMDSWSRTDPPGCTIALMPCLPAYSTQSLNGKKASLAITARSSRASAAWSMAIFSESIRFGWPAPTPRVRSLLATTIALDLVCLTAFQAKRRVSSCSCVGLASVTHYQSAKSSYRTSWSCTSKPPMTDTVSLLLASSFLLKSSLRIRRFFFLVFKAAKASSS